MYSIVPCSIEYSTSLPGGNQVDGLPPASSVLTSFPQKKLILAESLRLFSCFNIVHAKAQVRSYIVSMSFS